MQSLKWWIAGSVGGAIGAAIWVAVGYFSGFEVGWIAWGIGFLVGISVRAAAGEIDGPAPGIIAASTAVIAVLIAKYMVVSLLFSNAMSELPEIGRLTPEQMISHKATDIADELEAAGKKLNWPPQRGSFDVPPQQTFPPEVWAEAKKRWGKLTPQEQQAEMDKTQTEIEQLFSQLQSSFKNQAFTHSFSPWDLLWFGLAAFTAFKIGSGLADDE